MSKFSKSHRFTILVRKLSKMFLTYRKYVLICGTVLILLMTSLTLLQYRSTVKEARTFRILTNLEKLYLNSIDSSNFSNEATYNEIKNEFTTVIDDLGSTNKASNIAKIIFGNITYNAGAFEDAISLYSDVLQKLDDATVLKNLVLAKLAHCHFSNDNLDEAEVYFERILSDNRSIMKDEALFNIALIHESNGKLALAEKLYNQLLTYFPDSPYGKIVKQKVE